MPYRVLTDGQTLTTVEGTPLTVQRQGTTVRVGTPPVTRTLKPSAQRHWTIRHLARAIDRQVSADGAIRPGERTRS